MAANSGSFASGIGYNQQSGGYYVTIGDITGQIRSYTPGTGSGGATTAGTVGAFSWGTYGAQSTLIGEAGKLIKDMGKHVISAGRAFRKFQAVGTTAALSTAGVVGPAGTTDAGYLTFYLELPKGGVGPNGGVAPLIAKLS